MANDPNGFSLTYVGSRATLTLSPHQFESLAIEFCGKAISPQSGAEDDEYVADFTTASDLAQFRVALRCFTRK